MKRMNSALDTLPFLSVSISRSSCAVDERPLLGLRVSAAAGSSAIAADEAIAAAANKAAASIVLVWLIMVRAPIHRIHRSTAQPRRQSPDQKWKMASIASIACERLPPF